MGHPVWSISELALHFARAAADRAHARLTGGRCDGPETLLLDLRNEARALESAVVTYGTAVADRAFADPDLRGSTQDAMERRIRDLHGVVVSAATGLAGLACVAAIRGRAFAAEAPAADAPARALFHVLQETTRELGPQHTLAVGAWDDLAPETKAMLRRASDAVARVVRAEGTRPDHG